MDAEIIVYSLLFWLCAGMEITGMLPQEFRSAGVGIQYRLHSLGWFGAEELDFVGYHLRRTTLMLFAHSLLPLVYLVGLEVVSSYSVLLPFTSPWYVQLLTAVCLGGCGCGLAMSGVWSARKWKWHPLIKDLAACQQPINRVVGSVNGEFRQVEKFISVLGAHRLVVTDSWIAKIGPHSVRVINQYDAVLNVCKADRHLLSADGPGGAQYLTIEVISINEKISSFNIRLNSLEYTQLNERLTAPIRKARDIIVHQSLSDRFLLAFEAQVQQNGRHVLPPNAPTLEQCIGCLQVTSNVKLLKMCDSTGVYGCQSCMCRPLWCLQCMGKWFASRQDQNNPHTWMTGIAPCPMCRSVFCVLDVLLVTSNS